MPTVRQMLDALSGRGGGQLAAQVRPGDRSFILVIWTLPRDQRAKVVDADGAEVSDVMGFDIIGPVEDAQAMTMRVVNYLDSVNLPRSVHTLKVGGFTSSLKVNAGFDDWVEDVKRNFGV
jgi:hypothetical protein